MSELILRRILSGMLALVVVSIIMFTLLMLGPNPLDALKQNPAVSAEALDRIAERNGWTKPPVEQYMSWAKKFVTFDFGISIMDERPVSEKIFERLPLTLMLTGLSMVFSLMIAIPIGAYMALRKYSRGDYALTLITFSLMAAPSFFVALLFQLFALKLQDALGGRMPFYTGGPPTCVSDGSFFVVIANCAGTPIEVFQRLALPVTALSVLQIAGWSRYMRSELLGVLGQEYIRAATAKGISGRRVFIVHAMRNALLPIVTIVALDVALLFGGAVITERVFGLPGMGNLLLDSVFNKDVSVALAIVMIGAFLVLVMNTVADIMYGVLDPRVRVT